MVETSAIETKPREQFIAAQSHVLDRYGVRAESRFVKTQTLPGVTHVLVAGDGPPVVMMIGGGMVAGLWAPLMAELEGFTLYAIDPPGHGLTSPTAYRKQSIRSMAVGFLDDVLHGLDLDRALFISQSMGGLFTTWLALDRPDRVAAISYVACPAIFPGTSAPFPMRLSTIRWLRRLLGRVDPPSPAQVLRMAKMSGEDLSDLPEIADLFLAYERMPGALDTLLDLHRSLIRIRGARPEVAITDSQLTRLDVPVQMIWGEDDPYGPTSAGERAVRSIRGASLQVVPGGHGPWFTQPAEIAALIETFLRGSGA